MTDETMKIEKEELTVELEEDVFNDLCKLAKERGETPEVFLEKAIQAHFTELAMNQFEESLVSHQTVYQGLCA